MTDDDAPIGSDRAVAEIGMGPPRLEKIVGPNAFGDTAASVLDLFGVELRVFSASGAQLAGDKLEDVTVLGAAEAVARGLPASNDQRGANNERYRLLTIEYDGRAVGSLVIGPYALPGDVAAGMRIMQARNMDALCRHLSRVLDLVMFSGHKALLTSTMHLASMRESYRELQEKNEKLNLAYARLQELDRLKSNFIATVSHELRTPLTSIMGYSEMLAEGIAGPLNDEQADFVATIRTKSDQLLGLIVSLLDMSKLESGTFFVKPEAIDIYSVLTDVVSTLTPTAAKKGVLLLVERVPKRFNPVRGDADRLRQVFLNLTENAVKFTSPGGRVTLSVADGIDPRNDDGLSILAPLHRAVEVRVSDTGVGIPRAERDRVFAPFYQVDQSSTREQGGTGLGLAIVKRLVDAHNGAIRIEDNHPRGTVFVVTLPCVADAESVPPAGTSDQMDGDELPPIFQ
ncbi:MAG: HAMP domain-containing histidine kinase [Polyangiaceae bacterium]|nr:HAMP domain-containing histidine kinase [Polyangiaceae bacterium]